MPSDPYTDDEYDSTYEDVHGDEPARDQHVDETTDDNFFPSGAGDRLNPAGWGVWPSSRAGDAEYAETGETATGDESEDGGWWDEGLISLLLVGGLVLFLFPEPATSAVGVLMMGAGVIAWFVDWAT